MKNPIKQSLVILLSVSCFFANAQKAPIKLGNVPKEDIEMQVYSLDENADAVILYDYGYLEFVYNMQRGWENHLKRICRIKILNDDGYDWATEDVVLYHDGNLKETISQLKGYTYNIENGKVVKTKLDKGDIFDEELSENYRQVKFTMPNVKEGSVIEFSYTVVSDYLTILDRWKFQNTIPVRWSEYIVSIPEYLTYLKNSQGFASFDSYETDRRLRNINWTESTRGRVSLSGSTNPTVSSHKIDYHDIVHHWVAKDLPALKDENFVGNINNYHLGVDFQLSSYKTFSNKFQSVLSNWEQVNKKFNEDYDNFGPNMRARSFYKDITDKIETEIEDPMQRTAAVYRFVSQHMKWNNINSKMPSQNIKKSYEDRTGNCADINGLLVSMLRAVDVNADPVILSTINHGMVHPTTPIIDQYNYVIAKVQIADKYILLDATEKNQPFGMLPYRCLNQRGYAISSTNPGYISLVPHKGQEITTYCDLMLEQDGVLKGVLNTRKSGYSAVSARKKLLQGGEEKYIDNIKSTHTKWTINNVEVDAPKENIKPVKEKIELEVSGKAEVMGNMVYINPIISVKMDENPLKQEERSLPIEFIVPLKNTYMFNLTIPEGYEVDELPESISLVTPDRTASLKYMIQLNGNKLQLMHTWQIKKAFYTPDKFPELKEFYAMLVSKHNEQIVLKRTQAN